jgi:hypothetical protein
MKLDLEYDRVNAKLECQYYCYVWTSLDLTTAASSGSEIEANDLYLMKYQQLLLVEPQ